MRIFVLTATSELRVSRKSHLRDHPTYSVEARKESGTKQFYPLMGSYQTHILMIVVPTLSNITLKDCRSAVNVSLKTNISVKKFIFFFFFFFFF
jgi:hypothetical protein